MNEYKRKVKRCFVAHPGWTIRGAIRSDKLRQSPWTTDWIREQHWSWKGWRWKFYQDFQQIVSLFYFVEQKAEFKTQVVRIRTLSHNGHTESSLQIPLWDTITRYVQDMYVLCILAEWQQPWTQKVTFDTLRTEELQHSWGVQQEKYIQICLRMRLSNTHHTLLGCLLVFCWMKQE